MAMIVYNGKMLGMPMIQFAGDFVGEKEIGIYERHLIQFNSFKGRFISPMGFWVI